MPTTARAALLGAVMSGAGRADATLRANDATPVTGRQALPAALHTPRLTAPTVSERSRRTRSPVLMSTGHAVWHMPSTAHVSTTS